MKKVFLIATGIALLQVSGSAATCMTGSLASYIAMASAGCVLGNLTVSGFTYKDSASGGAAKITADEITVTPLLAPTGTYGLQFSAKWGIESGQKQGSDITYHVLSMTGTPAQLEQVRLDGSGFQAGLIGSVVVDEILGTPTATRSLEVFLKCTEVCRSQTSADLVFTPPAGALLVLDKATLESTQGAVAMTSFTDWFVICIPCA